MSGLSNDAVVKITQLLARYGHLVDAAKFRPPDHPSQLALDRIFTADGVFDAKPIRQGRHEGLAAIRRYFALPKPAHPPSHQTTNVVVTKERGIVRVRSKWHIIDWGGNPIVGEYRDIVTASDQGWLIQERVVHHLGGLYTDHTSPVNLVAYEEIKALKARYFRSIDAKDWVAFEALFTPDATMDMTRAGGLASGSAVIRTAPVIAATVSRFLADAETIHHGHSPEIRVGPDGVADGIWTMEDRIWRPHGAGTELEHGFGYYEDRYRRHENSWRISRAALERRRVERRCLDCNEA